MCDLLGEINLGLGLSYLQFVIVVVRATIYFVLALIRSFFVTTLECFFFLL